MKSEGWIGVDLDGTLATHDDNWFGVTDIGEPIVPMVNRVKAWLEAGKDVRVLTARVGKDPKHAEMDARAQPLHGSTPPSQIEKMIARRAIEDWCLKHIGKVLPITCSKDLQMIELWDDRVIRVVRNTGEISSQEEIIG